MKILITGIAGFIAFNFAKELCKNKNLKIIGIDNLSDYYSVKLKKKRVKNLKLQSSKLPPEKITVKE